MSRRGFPREPPGSVNTPLRSSGTVFAAAGAVTADHRRRLLNRLKRAAGQIRGIEAMVEMNKDPTAVLGQITAARAALAKVEQQLLREHIERSASGDTGQTGEALQALLDLLENRGRRE